MIDNNDGTVTYSQEEINNINTFLQKIYDRITDVRKEQSE